MRLINELKNWVHLPLAALLVLSFFVNVGTTQEASNQDNERILSISPSGEFAPPNKEPRAGQALGFENQIGSGMTDIKPRNDLPSQIGNFVTPLQSDYEYELPEDREEIIGEDGRALSETSGRVEVIRQRYPDGKVQILREVTQDKEGNYFNHGRWQLYNRQKEIMGQGRYFLGRMEGKWERWHPANSAGIFATAPFAQFQGPYFSTAEFSEGKLHGIWTITDKFKRTIFEMPYRNGIRNGTATWYHPNNKKMREMTFRDGLLDGPLMEWDAKGKEARKEEYYEGRKIINDLQYYRASVKKAQSYYLDSVLKLEGDDSWWEALPAQYVTEGERIQHGPITSWYENGQIQIQGQFRQGKREGTFVGWHANGQKQVTGQFLGDERIGTWTWWHPNGFKSIEGVYEDDNPVGDWIWWKEDGSIVDRRDMTDVSNNEDQKSVLENADQKKEDDQAQGDDENQAEEIEAEELPEKMIEKKEDGPAEIPESVIPFGDDQLKKDETKNQENEGDKESEDFEAKGKLEANKASFSQFRDPINNPFGDQ